MEFHARRTAGAGSGRLNPGAARKSTLNAAKARVAFAQSRARCSGSALSVMSVTTAALSAPALRHARRALQRDPADADERNVADALLPFPEAREALRREGHLLQYGRIDRAERDIVGLRRERAIKFGLVVRRDAESQPRAADRRQVGRHRDRSGRDG